MNPFAHKSAEELATMWQLRALAATQNAAPRMFRILWRVMANEYTAVTQNTWRVILRGMFNCDDLALPILLDYARVEQSGRVTSMVVARNGETRREALYRNKDEYTSDLRRLADHLHLEDTERVNMFAVMGRWIAADLRVNVHGEKRLAS